MTNEKFKALYEDALMHGWVTSKDPTKAAEQKKKQQEYNHQYYLKNKEKWNSGADRDYDRAKKDYDRAKKDYDNFERIINETANGPMTDARRRALEWQGLASDRLSEAKESMNKAHQKQLDVAKLRSERVKKSSNENRGYEQAVANRRKSAGETTKNRDERIKKSSNEAKAMEQAARSRRNHRVTENRKIAESEQMTKTRQQQNTRNKVRQKQIKESNVREDTFRTSSQRRKTRAEAERLARNSAHAKAKRTRISSFKNDRSANEAAAYSVARSLARQVRKQKRGQSSYPSKTTRRRTNIK